MNHPTPEVYDGFEQAFEFFNSKLFDGELRPCLLTLQRRWNALGFFSRKRFVNVAGEAADEIALNPSYFLHRGVQDVLSTLVHEMCHLWHEQYGTPGRRGYHNREPPQE